ncbi:hypothetical protein J5Y09_07870 [Roseomonas sp. PWR1]|uniref:Bile acid:sodium symporter n=1 Tax=Roseomonas nitratireducens TaxID=2820810 RepID=A0ABS4AR38_9PROT|nr:hypothetical protein [Neoroseomonas nitratireducens]MBP0463823.1 hypothetical protein [Neoroseomonas nitratireducens]
MRAALAGILGRIGDFGLFAPPVVFVLGLAVPPLALLGQAVLIPCVILLQAMSVGLAEPGRIHGREWLPVLLLAACNLLGTPLLVHGIALATGLDEAGGWLVLVAACPASGGAVLVASLLRLPVRPLLLSQLLCFFALPLTAPLVAGFVLQGKVVSPFELLWRVVLMVAAPALLGFLMCRLLGEHRRAVLARPMRGLGVVALCGITLSLAAGLPRLAVMPAVLGEAMVGLFLASLVGAALGMLSAAMMARGFVASFALGGAVRNVSLLWTAAIGLAPPEGELVLMLGTLWTILLPALLGLRFWRPLRLGWGATLALLARIRT